jgi:NhaP-type Na+/H+ or K+/H+ antiporter
VSEHLAKYEKLVGWGKAIGVLALASGGALFLVSEDQAPAAYLAIFITFQVAVVSLIILTIYISRFKRRHGIHRHG